LDGIQVKRAYLTENISKIKFTSKDREEEVPCVFVLE